MLGFQSTPHGAGLLDFFRPPNARGPKALRDFVDRNGSQIVDGLTVYRKPLAGPIKKAVSLLSSGAINRKAQELGYDDLFHLGLIFRFQTGDEYLFEHNQTVSFTKMTPQLLEGASLKPVNMGNRRGFTLSQLFRPIYYKLGDRLTWYDVRTNNCQTMVIDSLVALGMLTPELRTFIEQDAQQLLGTMRPIVGTVARFATDTARRFDQMIHGTGQPIMRPKKGPRKARQPASF